MAILTRDDLHAVLGRVDDGLAAEILRTGASAEELVEARAWLADDEAPMNSGRPLASGRVARLIEILEAEQDEAEAEARPSLASH